MSGDLRSPQGRLTADHLAAVIETADDAIVSKRLDGTITSWNQGAEQLFGYTSAEMVGGSIMRLVPPDRQGEEAEIIAQLVQGRRVRHFETVRLRKDGTPVDVSVSIAPIFDSDGTVIGASKIARNNSEAVAARSREVRLKQFMRALIQASRAIARPTPDSTLLKEICEICVQLGGVTAAFVVRPGADAPSSLVLAGSPRSDVERLVREEWVSAAIAQAIRNNQALVAGPRDAARTESGGCALAALPLRRDPAVDGSLVLVADSEQVFDDATLELLGELAADLSFALATRERAAEFESIVQSASDAIIVVDASRRILRINPAASEMFMWPESEAIGQSIDRLIPVRFRDAHAGLMKQFAKIEAAPRRMGAARALAGCRLDGTEFPIEATVSRFGSGLGLRMFVAIRDVSARREAEQAQIARHQAESANRAKSEFLSYMSHELRTPLNAVLGFAQVLMDDRSDPLLDRQREQVRQIRTAGRHLHALISDLLDMGRIEAGNLTVSCQALAISDVLDQVVPIVSAMAKSAALTFELPRGLSTLPPVMADATRLCQILLNLLSNAVKYNRPRGTVSIEVATSESEVTLSIVDTGIGMDEEQLRQLFQPYNRLGRESGQIGGTGIGLFVTRGLAELMGAQLRLESAPQVGTRAHLVLQRTEDLAVESAFEDSGSGALDALPLVGRVISVEDNPVNQMLLATIFERWPKVEFLQAMDGRSGLALVREWIPDLVLLDLNLPDMDGFQFMRELAAESLLQSIKVVVLSATADAEDIARAASKGAAAYLTKPVHVPLLTEKVSAILAEQNRVRP